MTLDAFFSGFDRSRRIYAALAEAVTQLGAVETRVTKSQIAFRHGRDFAWAWIPGRYLGEGHAPLVLSLRLPQRDDWPRWKEIVEPAPGRFMHHLELHAPDEIDAEVISRLQRAWEVAALERPRRRNSPAIELCIEGTRAEYEGRLEDARALYAQAWEAAKDDYEACATAHYVARFQEDPEQRLAWNRKALQHAEAAQDERVKAFFPSLYLNLGQTYALLGRMEEAQRYYALAAELGIEHRG